MHLQSSILKIKLLPFILQVGIAFPFMKPTKEWLDIEELNFDSLNDGIIWVGTMMAIKFPAT